MAKDSDDFDLPPPPNPRKGIASLDKLVHGVIKAVRKEVQDDLLDKARLVDKAVEVIVYPVTRTIFDLFYDRKK